MLQIYQINFFLPWNELQPVIETSCNHETNTLCFTELTASMAKLNIQQVWQHFVKFESCIFRSVVVIKHFRTLTLLTLLPLGNFQFMFNTHIPLN